MQESTDDQLDGLFRKSAEEFDTPFDPAAWQVLKNRLDTHDRLTVWEHLLRWGLPVLLLLLLTAGSWNAHRIQTQKGQTAESDVAMKPIAVSADPMPGRSAQGQSHRVSRDQPPATALSAVSEQPAETAPAGADPGRRAGVDGTKPGRSEQALAAVKVSPTNGKPDVAMEAAATRDRSGKVDATRPATRQRHPIALTDERANRLNLPDPSLASISATPATSGRPDRIRLKTVTGRAVEPGAVSVRTAGAPKNVGGRSPSRSGTGKGGVNRALPFSTPNQPTGTTRSVGEPPLTANVTRKSAVQTRKNTATSFFPADVPDRSPTAIRQELASPNVAEPIVLPSFIELTSRTGQWPDRLPFRGRAITASELPILPTDAPEMKTQPVVQPVVSQKGLSVRFVVAPDLSAIGLRNFQRPGTNVGLLLEYRLASRWSVQAGLIQSTKVYKALASDYKLSAYSSKWKVFPESVNGRCSMLDIPINLRYDIALQPRLNGQAPSRWFVSAGVTTYIMRQEDYVNNFSEADKPHVYPGMEGFHGKTGTYGFSQLNLSAGYERALSRRLSWQVEPFLKAPLKGIGYYKINLLSTGAFFSIRYKL